MAPMHTPVQPHTHVYSPTHPEHCTPPTTHTQSPTHRNVTHRGPHAHTCTALHTPGITPHSPTTQLRFSWATRVPSKQTRTKSGKSSGSRGKPPPAPFPLTRQLERDCGCCRNSQGILQASLPLKARKIQVVTTSNENVKFAVQSSESWQEYGRTEDVSCFFLRMRKAIPQKVKPFVKNP